MRVAGVLPKAAKSDTRSDPQRPFAADWPRPTEQSTKKNTLRPGLRVFWMTLTGSVVLKDEVALQRKNPTDHILDLSGILRVDDLVIDFGSVHLLDLGCLGQAFRQLGLGVSLAFPFC